MNDNHNWRNIGEQMKNALADALQTGDFRKLNNLVSQTVANTLNEVGIHIMPDNESRHKQQYDSDGFSGSGKAQADNKAWHDKAVYGTDRTNNKQSAQNVHDHSFQSFGQASDRHEQSFHRWGDAAYNKGKMTHNWQKAPDSFDSHGQATEDKSQDVNGQAYGNGKQTANGHGYSSGQTANGRGYSSGQTANGHGYSSGQTANGHGYSSGQTANGRGYSSGQSANGHAFSGRQHDESGQAFNRHKKAQINRKQMAQMQMQASGGYNSETSLVKIKKVGGVSNVLYQAFGSMGFGITLLIALIEMTVYLAGGIFSATGCIVTLFFLSLFFGMIRLGIFQNRRLKRAKRYVQLCNGKMFEDIKKLAESTGNEERYVVKDLQRMLRIGMFPEGHLDSNKTCFMLNDRIYRQYLETADNHRKIQEEQQRRIAQEEENTTSDMLTEQEKELNAMISEGMECIKKLRVLNDKISGEVISSKLFRLENLLKDIFERVREHPEQMNRMHKLMSYYLPTTLKLIETYEEFDQISSPGKDIIDAKAEIENTLDTINQAFTELLNNLFQDAVFDATTDAQVLKTMLAREGLMSEIKFTADDTEK